ncbi:MAG TPA: preprotein translocase subunit SecG [Candidatus Eremiobacteraceae bacterium]|nr:preprotein translocase subunit SecG [Candidatus Eremiobacteraceae bacterium]
MASSILATIVSLAAGSPSVPTPAPLPSALFQFQQQTFATKYPILVEIIQWLFILSAFGLVALMSVQTTKNEGLSGSIGGRAEASYRGRLGFDQQLTRLTGGVAVAFVFLAILYFIATR